MKKFGRVAVIVFLVLTSLAGIANAVNEFGEVDTALQMSVEVGDALWGIFGLLTAIGIWRRRFWVRTTSLAWAATLTYTGTVASFAFSDPAFSKPETKAGVIAAAISLSVISALIVWAARVASRAQASRQPTPV